VLRGAGRRFGLDALIGLAAIESMLEARLRHDSLRAPTVAGWLAVLVVLPLLARRWFPFAAPLAVWPVGATLSFVDGRLVVFSPSVFVAGMVSAFLLGHLGDPVRARFGLAAALAGAAIVVSHDPARTPGEFIFIPVLFAIGWLAGFTVRERAAEAAAAEQRARQAEQARAATARVAVAEERARIARELHDIVAHAMSVMVLHVGAVRHRLPAALTDEAEALRGVEQTGRSALSDMRRVLGATRGAGADVELAPQPGLADLATLAAEVTRAGLPVTVHLAGAPVPLPPAIDLSAYRIVQEGLTNALKHAHAGRADVTVRFAPEEVQIEVRDDGPGGLPGDQLGLGLVGVRERVKIYGGEMSAAPSPERGFVLRARLPLPEGAP
jgi:signal transduction histidine kinase